MFLDCFSLNLLFSFIISQTTGWESVFCRTSSKNVSAQIFLQIDNHKLSVCVGLLCNGVSVQSHTLIFLYVQYMWVFVREFMCVHVFDWYRKSVIHS